MSNSEKNRVSDLRRCDGFEALLAGSVPDLGLDGAACFESDALGGKLDADGRVLVLRQLILDVSAEQMRLAHASVPHKNHYN